MGLIGSNICCALSPLRMLIWSKAPAKPLWLLDRWDNSLAMEIIKFQGVAKAHFTTNQEYSNSCKRAYARIWSIFTDATHKKLSSLKDFVKFDAKTENGTPPTHCGYQRNHLPI